MSKTLTDNKKAGVIAYIDYLLSANSLAPIPNLDTATADDLHILFIKLTRMSSYEHRKKAFHLSNVAIVRSQMNQVIKNKL